MHKGQIKPVWILLILGVLLAGCDQLPQEAEQLFDSDTIIDIPLNPESTQQQTEAVVPETDAAPTQEPKEEARKSTGSGSSSGSRVTGQSSKPSQTQPPETAPPETDPPETDPPETDPPEPTAYDASGYVPGAPEYAVAEQINAYRAEAGLQPLALDVQLSGIASVRAYEACGFWSHTRPDGREWQSILSDNGYACSAAAEELAHATGFDGTAIVDKWMDAESNRTDLLNPDFTAIGVGTYTENGAAFLAVILIGP